MLAKEQYIGAAVFFGIALAAWFFFAIRSSKPTEPDKPHQKSWAERKDSIRTADSLRFKQWKEEREARYDSVKQALAVRHEAYKAELQQWYDSTRVADSLWRDSVGIRYVKKEKKDTILDLNHCDTAELQLIRGIGHYTALQIIGYRDELGGYNSPEQLCDERLKKLSLDTLLNHFTARPEDTKKIDVNHCSTERLQRHPYLSFTQAKAIYQLRRSNVRLRGIDDLRQLKEIDSVTLSRLQFYLDFQ